MNANPKKDLCEKQYQLICKCAKNNDFSEWNEYVKNFDGIIKLREANFDGLNITGANFYTEKNGKENGADLYKATFKNSHIKNSNFSNCYMNGANFQKAKICNSNFRNADLSNACMNNSLVALGDFINTKFCRAELISAKFCNSDFYESDFREANLRGVHFFGGGYNPIIINSKEFRFNLCGTNFSHAIFDSHTYFGLADVSKKTDFRSFFFENANFSIGLKQTLQYCNRRHNWNEWCEKQNFFVQLLTKLFWIHSDYGRSLKRIIAFIFFSCFFFATIYFIFPQLICDLKACDPIRSLYFSVVTMTTLGFGDMYAARDNWIAQCIVMVQVLYGYVLLGALITVLSNLFTSDGPAQGLIKHPEKPKLDITVKFR